MEKWEVEGREIVGMYLSIYPSIYLACACDDACDDVCDDQVDGRREVSEALALCSHHPS